MAAYLPLLFYFFAAIAIFFAYKVITSPNPVHSALYLVLTMLMMAGFYFHLNAEFIAGVQIIVYAGAVMVLFVMVLMLFDLKHELRSWAKGAVSGTLKLGCAGIVAGIIIGSVGQAPKLDPAATPAGLVPGPGLTRDLAVLLYSKYLLPFEVLGVLLLIVAVGAVAISRVRGGTHAKH